MPIPQKTIRGVQDINSNLASMNKTNSSFQIYLRIAILEMGMHRLAKERESITRRLNLIDTRSNDMQAEKEKLMKMVDLEVSRESKSTTQKIPSANPSVDKSPFTIRY